MSLHEDSDQDAKIPEVAEDLRIHLMSINGANKKLRTKVEDLSTHIAGVEDRLNVCLTTSDRQRDDGLRVVTESLNRLTAVVQRLEARDAAPRQSRSPSRIQGHSGDDLSDVSDARGGHRRHPRRGVEVRHDAGQRRNQGGEAAQEDGGLGRIKLTIPEFSGRSDPEKYLEWEMRVNQIFDGHNYSEEKKVRVASMEFTEYALVWWDNKNRTGERPATWVDMKRVMREVFVPAYYTRQLHSKLRRLVEGTKSVDEYYKEMQILMIRTAVRESPEATMVRFFEGLEEKIRDRVDLMQYNDIHELLHQAERAERWVLEKKTADIRPSYISGRRHSSHADDGAFGAKPVVYSKSGSIEHSKITAASKEDSQTASSMSHHSNIVCHKCGGRGHIMRVCPNKKQILLVDDAYISESEDEMPALEDDTKNEDGTLDGWPALNVPTLMAHKVQRDNKVIVEPGQRRSIFQTACTIKGEICKLIVDGGSASNMISKDVVESLSLPTWEHPKPYYMQWINGVGKLKVTHRVKVPFAVDGYTNKVECDVLPLHVCHLLLGRPWQHDVNALHHGRTNRYTFMHEGEFHNLLPKDAEDIKCTVEVFKKKSARHRSKPRTVSLQGREDDEDHSTSTDNSITSARYVVPARRRIIARVNKDVNLDQGTSNVSVLKCSARQIVPKDEVKPTFRTPCRYIMVGAIKVQV